MGAFIWEKTIRLTDAEVTQPNANAGYGYGILVGETSIRVRFTNQVYNNNPTLYFQWDIFDKTHDDPAYDAEMHPPYETIAQPGYYRETDGQLFWNLLPGTTYGIELSLSEDEYDYGGTLLDTVYVTTSQRQTVRPWSWESSDGDSTVSERDSAKTALLSHGSLEGFSYKVWNDMVDKVKEVQDYHKKTWDSTHATYSETKMDYSDKSMTAKRFNALQDNIYTFCDDQMHNNNDVDIPDEVSPGDVVYGWYFLTMMEYVNYYV